MAKRDLAGHWSFNEGTGSATADSTASGNDGTLMDGGAGSGRSAVDRLRDRRRYISNHCRGDGIVANDIDIDGDSLTVTQVNGSGANVGSTFTLASGASLTVNAAGDFTYDPNGAFEYLDSGQRATDSFTYQVDDGNGGTETATVLVTITGINDAPTVATNTGTIVLEGSTANVISSVMLNEGDLDDDGSELTYTVTASPAHGTLYLAGFGALGLNDTFTQADLDAGNVSYDHDGSETTADSFDFSLADGGEDAAAPATGTFNLTIDPVNDVPIFAVTNATPTFTENGGPVSLFSGTSVDLIEAGDRLNTLILTVDALADGSDEILVVDGQAIELTHLNNETTAIGGYDVSVTLSGNTATVTITKTGGYTAAAAEVLVDGIAYDNASENPQGAARLVTLLSIKDDGGTANGGNDTTGIGIASLVSMMPVNDEQVLSTNTGTTVLEGSTGNVITTAMLETTDVDNTAGQLIYTLTGTPANGVLRRSGVDLSVSSTFTQADIDAGIITYLHNDTETASDSFSFTVDDGAGSSSSGTFNITVTPVNDNNPVITSDGGGASAAINVLENSLYVTTVAATDADLPAETLTYSIVGGVDAVKFSVDGSTGALTFVASPDFESPTDSGANNVYDVVVQVSDGTFADTQAIAVTVNDVSDSGQYLDLLNVESYSNDDGTENWSTNWVESDSGGGGAGSGNIDAKGGSFRIKVANTNDNVYREADLSNAISATLSFTYNSAMQFGDAGQLAVQVSSNGGASYTTLSGAIFDDTTNTGSGSKSIDISSHLAADTRIRLIVTSGGGSKQIDIDNIEISYTPNSDPVITSNGAGATASVSVAENSTSVTTVTASDADLPGQTLIYSIIGGVDAAKFSIDSGSGALTFVAAPDFESPTDTGGNNVYDVVVQVSDGIATDTQAIAVTVTDFDEFDVGAVSDTDVTANAVDENATVGTVVGIDASASDADATNNTITYSLSDDDGGRFTIDSNTGVVTVNGAIDRETDGASRSITVRASSSDTSFTDQVFVIAVNDIDEFDVGPISDSDASGNAVNENAANGTVVGVTALAADADATNNAITYTLDDNAGGRFAIDGSTGVVTVADGTLLDRESAASHNITVRATSSDGSFNTQLMTINVIDVDEFDVGPVTDIDGAQTKWMKTPRTGRRLGSRPPPAMRTPPPMASRIVFSTMTVDDLQSMAAAES